MQIDRYTILSQVNTMDNVAVKMLVQVTSEEAIGLTESALKLGGCITDDLGRVVRRPPAIIISESPSLFTGIRELVSHHKVETAAAVTLVAAGIIGVVVCSKKKKERMEAAVNNFNAAFLVYWEAVMSGTLSFSVLNNLMKAFDLLEKNVKGRKREQLFPAKLLIQYAAFMQQYTEKLARKNKIRLGSLLEPSDEFGILILPYYLDRQKLIFETVEKRNALEAGSLRIAETAHD